MCERENQQDVKHKGASKGKISNCVGGEADHANVRFSTAYSTRKLGTVVLCVMIAVVIVAAAAVSNRSS